MLKRHGFSSVEAKALISIQRNICPMSGFFSRIIASFVVLLQTTTALLIILDILRVKY